jgi:hypothetical protein
MGRETCWPLNLNCLGCDQKKQTKRPMRPCFQYYTWVWEHVVLFLSLSDAMKLICFVKANSFWHQMLKRDFPNAFHIAVIEEFNMKDWYKEIYMDQITIEEYVQIRNDSSHKVDCCFKMIAKGSLQELAYLLLCYQTNRHKIDLYLD